MSLLADCQGAPRSQSVLFTGSVLFVWFAVWYLCATLSESVQVRDRKLREANERLLKASQATNRQVLRTTHDLKAPFSGIQSNIEVLKATHWDEVPESVRTLIDRIDRRSKALALRIHDVLLLGALRDEAHATVSGDCRLDEAVRAALEDVQERAAERRVTLSCTVPPVTIPGDLNRYVILFSNLLANAVNYSHEGGSVEVATARNAGHLIVSVTDHGIGIKDDALLGV